MNTNKQIPQYPSGSLIEQRRDFILYELAQGRGELTDEVYAELAEPVREQDAADDPRTPEQIQADIDWRDEMNTIGDLWASMR